VHPIAAADEGNEVTRLKPVLIHMILDRLHRVRKIPISMPTTVIAVLSVRVMACSLSVAPWPASVAGGGGARPNHPIDGNTVCIAPVNEHLVDYLVAASARW
jgi:hypothetical protein